jgi:hypothetical protein
MKRQQAKDSEFIGSNFGMGSPIGTHNPPSPLRFRHGVNSFGVTGSLTPGKPETFQRDADFPWLGICFFLKSPV